MVNILLENYAIDDDKLFDTLKEYIKPHHKILIVAFSFRDNQASCLSDWESLYGSDRGIYYGGITNSLRSYGIKEENIQFLNYFTDTKETAKNKVISSDILYFLGGLPDKMYDRLKEFDLIGLMSKYNGIAMGYSAGAVIQLAEYYLSPDKDYPKFAYYPGIPYLNDFYLEVHYENTEIQNLCIQKSLAEKHKPVYAFRCDIGAMIVDNGNIRTIGDVDVFEPDI